MPEPSDHHRPRASVLLRAAPLAILLVATAIAYFNADHEELLFDSTQSDLLAKPARHWSETFHDFWRTPLKPGQQLTYVTFALNFLLNRAMGLDGLDVTGFVVFNVLLHGLNACLVYLLIRSILRQVDPQGPPPVLLPLGIALLFAVHPIHVGSVTYIMQRRSTMASTFYLTAVLLFLRARRTFETRMALRQAWGRFAACAFAILLCFWLGCRSKEIALTLPLTLILVEFCLRANRWSAGRFWTYALGGVFAYFVLMLGGLWAIGRLNVQTMELSAYGERITWGVWQHFLTMCGVLAQYLRLLIVPAPRWLCLDHPAEISTGVLDHAAGLAILLHAVLIGLGFAAIRRRYVLAGVGILWFYAVQAPYMFLPQKEFFVEYKAYLPSVGIMLVLAEGCLRSSRFIGARTQLAVINVAAVVLIIITHQRNALFDSSYAFWSDIAAKNPRHYRPHDNLGSALLHMGRLDDAEKEYTESLKYWPGNASCLNNMGMLCLKRDQLAQAEAYFRKAIASWPASQAAHFNLGVVYWKQGKKELAEQYYRKTIQLNPDHEEAWNNLAGVLLIAGRDEEAIACYRKVLELRPDNASACKSLLDLLIKVNRVDEALDFYPRRLRLIGDSAAARNELGAALFRAGRTAQAIEQFDAASRLDPSDAQPWFNAGTAFLSEKRYAEAASRYETVLRLKPDHAEAHNRLGYALEQLGRTDEARAHYAEAVKLRPQDPIACWNLAEILQKAGESERALDLYERVCRLQPDHARAHEKAADLLWSLGRRSEAAAHYQHVLRLEPDNARVKARAVPATAPATASTPGGDS
jgi:tetratricopeptide (TPR) repeat protein